MENEELVKNDKKQAETINTLADNQRILIERISKLENRDATVDTELAINKAVDKIVSSVTQQTTPVPVVTPPTTPEPVPATPAPAEPTPTTPAPAEPTTPKADPEPKADPKPKTEPEPEPQK